MTMGASIECRVPFLDYRLVETLAALPSETLLAGGPSKRLLRRALGDRLPEAVLGGRKWGFAVPWSRYFREVPVFRDLIRDLPDLAPICDGPFDRRRLAGMAEAFLTGEGRDDALIRQLVMIAVWYRTRFGRSAGWAERPEHGAHRGAALEPSALSTLPREVSP
jgi:asparagine synthase (glutamine-hydrolysing)